MGLQNQQFSLTPPYEGINFTALVRWRTFSNILSYLDGCRGPVYFYSLGSSIGSSPHPCHWERMISLYGERFGDCPDRMTCVEQVWEAWWIKYMTHNLIFTMYSAHQVHCFNFDPPSYFNLRTPSQLITARPDSITKLRGQPTTPWCPPGRRRERWRTCRTLLTL